MNKEIILKMPTDYSEDQLVERIEKELKIKDFSWQINRKSLDARRKSNIHWVISVSVSSKCVKGASFSPGPVLNIPYNKRKKKVLVVGSGPAGFFCAFILQKAGFDTILIERGAEVGKRSEGIKKFEATGIFDPVCNYAFGEGGAGTFSDGKLTSRSKRISLEREFVVSSYIDAGAPEEIRYMTHPHLGSDNLKKIVRVLREQFSGIGGKILFETFLEDIKTKDGKVYEAVTTAGDMDLDAIVIAPGHSAYDTYRMLISKGVRFIVKNFAIGCRVEHSREMVNEAQWGQKCLKGVKAAEYRLTSDGDGNLPVYTFCMCPGGTIVPAAAFDGTNVVNGMSLYARDGHFSNSACVAGINLNVLYGREIGALKALDWLEGLERKFYGYSDSFKAPFCTIKGFIEKKEPGIVPETSYSLGLEPSALWEMLPSDITRAITGGLKVFSRKMKGFDSGIIMGLESKSSAPVQVLRTKKGLCEGFNNLYVAGEGSGWAGGIISSAADGIKTAMHIINR